MTEKTSFQIVVNHDLCEANARCVVSAPDIFEIDANEMLVVHRDKAVPERLEAAERAAARCPKAALTILKRS